MGRMRVRLVARALVTLCLVACAVSGAPAAQAAGGETIAQAPSIKVNAVVRGRLYDSNFYSGYSVAYWTARFVKGDHITIRTTASGGATPPCQMLFMPGTDDINVGATTPILDPATQTRDGSRDFQRWVTATQTGTYILAMTNADVFLSGPHQCLDAPTGKPFTFKVTVAHRGPVRRASSNAELRDRAGGERDSGVTHIVEPGQSLWMIAQGLVPRSGPVAEIALTVERLWRLNAARIGTGDPDLIFPGLRLRLK